ncbi:uncharacterized protein RCC_10589 [Ramularia collo-cygni]|uniref:Uncharacterized protein n=1 Tax=Ramularia collo-cygni TaxID=112498 RepID=A0A2D3VK61_9PEZI|nr:uncharacterized protein RCC_10589 [Ramularia collo-cygni]CZT24861.1 uncharacterized protein RCC_10589 [Ramularia collo-cygni]
MSSTVYTPFGQWPVPRNPWSESMHWLNATEVACVVHRKQAIRKDAGMPSCSHAWTRRSMWDIRHSQAIANGETTPDAPSPGSVANLSRRSIHIFLRPVNYIPQALLRVSLGG